MPARLALKGRNYFEFKNPITGEYSPYADWSLWGTSHIFDDMPTEGNHVPGTGYSPHNVQYSQWFLGTGFTKTPLDEAGVADRELAPFRPFEHKGLDSAAPLSGDYGHAPGVVSETSLYSNFVFDGLDSAEVMSDVGHGPRFIGDPEAANTFGRFEPLDHQSKAVGEAVFEADFGAGVPDEADGDMGHNRVLEHFGVPSSQIL